MDLLCGSRDYTKFNIEFPEMSFLSRNFKMNNFSIVEADFSVILLKKNFLENLLVFYLISLKFAPYIASEKIYLFHCEFHKIHSDLGSVLYARILVNTSHLIFLLDDEGEENTQRK